MRQEHMRNMHPDLFPGKFKSGQNGKVIFHANESAERKNGSQCPENQIEKSRSLVRNKNIHSTHSENK